MFKGMLLGIIGVGFWVAIAMIGGTMDRHYSIDGTITNIDYERVTVVDTVGQEFDFYGDGYTEGQTVRLKFDNNGTDNNRTDDYLIDVIIK